jgi:sigma-B regulation protein RsbU (phosphoserine phosphatase)
VRVEGAGAPAREDVPLAATVQALLGTLLEASHDLDPDRLGSFVERQLVDTGFDAAAVYLVDHEQRALVPIGDGESRLRIDGTAAGRVYRQEVPAMVRRGASARLWVPMRDGVERLGVVSFDTAAFAPDLVRACERLTTLVAELVLSKQQFSDVLRLKRRSRPMTLAAELRWSILPPASFSTPRVTLAASLEPPYEVSGDAYDYAMNGDAFHVAIFDGMGHGLDAARLADLAMAAYRHSRRCGTSLRDMYRAIGSVIADTFGSGGYVTAQLGALDVETGVLELVNAGHPGPLLLRKGRVRGTLRRSTAMPLGVDPDGVPTVDR